MAQGVGVMMVRRTLQDVVSQPVPAGFQVRRYLPGDEAAWTRIWSAADVFGQATPKTFHSEFGKEMAALPERMFFLCDAAGREVGTATAWFGRPEVDAEAGMVHWVAIVPEMQGRGLAKPLMAAVLCRLRELGHLRAYLMTQERRVAAIKLYLDLGFDPEVRSDQERAAWQRVQCALRKTRLDGMDFGARE